MIVLHIMNSPIQVCTVPQPVKAPWGLAMSNGTDNKNSTITTCRQVKAISHLATVPSQANKANIGIKNTSHRREIHHHTFRILLMDSFPRYEPESFFLFHSTHPTLSTVSHWFRCANMASRLSESRERVLRGYLSVSFRLVSTLGFCSAIHLDK